jgi:hypothetical protein
MNANNITFFIVIIFTLKFRLLLFKVYVQLIQTYKISYLPITATYKKRRAVEKLFRFGLLLS